MRHFNSRELRIADTFVVASTPYSCAGVIGPSAFDGMLTAVADGRCKHSRDDYVARFWQSLGLLMLKTKRFGSPERLIQPISYWYWLWCCLILTFWNYCPLERVTRPFG